MFAAVFSVLAPFDLEYMLGILPPETILSINVYWKSVLLAGCLACIIAKVRNWQYQRVKSIPPTLFLAIITLSLTSALSIGMVKPYYLAMPLELINNLGYSAFLIWYGLTKCWATYRGSLYSKRHGDVPAPMAYR